MAIAFLALPGAVPGSLSCILGATCQAGGLLWWTPKQGMGWHADLLPAPQSKRLCHRTHVPQLDQRDRLALGDLPNPS